MLTKFRKRVVGFIQDPFGKSKIQEIHDPIIRDIIIETQRVRRVRRGPLARTLGKQLKEMSHAHR